MQTIAKILTDKYDLNTQQFFAVIECESGWVPDIQSQYMQDYGQEESYGIAQIHAPDHPNITYEQSISPIWSLSWMAEEWSKGRSWKWSCYNNLVRK